MSLEAACDIHTDLDTAVVELVRSRSAEAAFNLSSPSSSYTSTLSHDDSSSQSDISEPDHRPLRIKSTPVSGANHDDPLVFPELLPAPYCDVTRATIPVTRTEQKQVFQSSGQDLEAAELLPVTTEPDESQPSNASKSVHMILKEIRLGKIDFKELESYKHSTWLIPFFYGQLRTQRHKIEWPLPRLMMLRNMPVDATRGLHWQSRACYNPRNFSDPFSFGPEEMQHYAVSLAHYERYTLGFKQHMMRLSIPNGYDTALSLLSAPVDVTDPLFKKKIRALTTPPTGSHYRSYVLRGQRELQSHIIRQVAQGDLLYDATTGEIYRRPGIVKPEPVPQTLEIWVQLSGKDSVALDNIMPMWVILRLLAETRGNGDDSIDWVRVVDEFNEFERTAKIEWVDRYLDGCDSCREKFDHDQRCTSCLHSVFVATYARRMKTSKTLTSVLFVEYPGYGMSDGHPSKTTFIEHTVKSILEAIRCVRAQWTDAYPSHPCPRVVVNFYAFSLGCAVALSAIRLLQKLPITVLDNPVKILNSSLSELVAMKQRKPNFGTQVCSFQHCLMFAPFLSTRKVAADIIRPIIFKPFTNRMVNWLIDDEVDWDNGASLKEILNTLSTFPEEEQARFHLAIVHGENDDVVRIDQYEELIRHLNSWIKDLKVKVAGVKVKNANHCDVTREHEVLGNIFREFYTT